MKSKGVKIAAIAATVLLVTLIALPHLVDVDRFRPELESSLTSVLGRQVHIGHMELSLLSGGARVEHISIADDPAFSSANFLQAKSLGVGVNLLSLILSHSLHVTSLTLEEPQLRAIQSADGKWNFSSLGGGAKGQTEDRSTSETLAQSVSSAVLDSLKISKATIQVYSEKAEGKPTILNNIDVDLKHVSFDQAMSFTISAHTESGKLEIRGEAGPVNRDNADETPFHATINAKKADLAQIAASSGLGGILDVDGSVSSDGSTIHSEGKASAEKLRLARGGRPATQTISLEFRTDYVIAQKTGVLREGEIHVGKSAANLSGSFNGRGKHLIVNVKVSGNHLPLDTVEGALPALGIVLPGGSKLHGGTVDANLSLEGPVNHIVTSGSAQIQNAHLAGFDLGSKLSSLPGLSGLKGNSDLSIVNLGTRLRITPEETHISGFNCKLAGIGSITGDGDVTEDDHLNFKMVAHVASDGALRFGLNRVGLKQIPNDVPFQVVGTTSVPVIIPDLSAMAKTTSKAVAKQVATNAGKSAIKKIMEGQHPTNAPVQTSSNKKGGFFHKLFGRKDKEARTTNSMQMASERSKF